MKDHKFHMGRPVIKQHRHRHHTQTHTNTNKRTKLGIVFCKDACNVSVHICTSGVT